MILEAGILNPASHFLAIRRLVELLSRHRQLTWEMTKREIAEKYAGQVLGSFWALCHPILLMGLYVFVFGYIFQTRLNIANPQSLDYTAYILSGLIPWITCQDIMNKGVTVVVSHANLVKQVVFPIEVLPVKGVLAAFLSQGISTLILMVYVLVTRGSLPWTYALLPFLFTVQLLGMIGVAYVLSAIGVYFRDLKEVITVFTSAGLFIIPALYLPSSIPPRFQALLYLNPFSYMVWSYQDVGYFGRIEHPWAWVVFAALGILSFYGGFRLFHKLQPTFGNLL